MMRFQTALSITPVFIAKALPPAPGQFWPPNIPGHCETKVLIQVPSASWPTCARPVALFGFSS